MPQLVGWDLGAEGDPGVPGGEGLCVGAQGWQPCPRPLTQHRHRQCRAGNSRCRQCAGSCQARLPDPGRLGGQTEALPCSPRGRDGQMPSTALAGPWPRSWGPCQAWGWQWLSLGQVGRIAGETELLGCHPSCLPAMASARAEHSQHQPFFQGSDRKDSLQCLYPPASDVLGGGTDPPAQGSGHPCPQTEGWHHRSSWALQSGCPDACWLAQPQECPVPSPSMLSSPLRPMACREPVGGGQPQSPICLHPPASWQHPARHGHFAGSQLHVPTCPMPPALQ